jgi:hypothetical protein
MRRHFLPIVTAIGLAISLAAFAQTPAVTATCKDGTPFSGTTRSGACRGHGGVQTWDTAAPSATAPATGAAGDRYYGKTKAGEYMSESQAKSSGFRPDHNKACVS